MKANCLSVHMVCWYGLIKRKPLDSIFKYISVYCVYLSVFPNMYQPQTCTHPPCCVYLVWLTISVCTVYVFVPIAEFLMLELHLYLHLRDCQSPFTPQCSHFTVMIHIQEPNYFPLDIWW